MTEQQVNININDGDPFFAHEMSMNFTPTQFTLDFKCITPRNDPRNKETASFLLKHNVVMIDPWHAKAIYEVLGGVLKQYEKDFGKISKPEAITKAEKKHKKTQKPEGSDTPSYLG